MAAASLVTVTLLLLASRSEGGKRAKALLGLKRSHRRANAPDLSTLGVGTQSNLASWLSGTHEEDDFAQSAFASNWGQQGPREAVPRLLADAPTPSLSSLQSALSGYHADQLVKLDPASYRYISYEREPDASLQCERFERSSQQLPAERGYWPGIDGTGREYLYGTVWGQEEIWKHQHPSNCRDVKVALIRSFPSGIGSMIDTVTHLMSMAFRAGHVAMWHPQDKDMWGGDWCGEATTLDCYFEPLTNCTVENTGVDIDTAPVLAMERGSGVDMEVKQEMQDQPLADMDTMLDCSPIADHVKRHWWKNQATAYLMRPNQRVLEELGNRQAQMFHFEPPGTESNAFRTVSVHIRWSDAKRKEADLVPPEEMWKAAAALKGIDSRLNRLFISTESPQAIEEAKALGGWEATFVEVERDRAEHDTLEQAKAGKIRPDEEMLNSLLNLHLALQSDAFVCNRYSNWCGLIDSLRLTAGKKADRPLLDNGGPCKFCHGDYDVMLSGLCTTCPW